MAKNDETFNLSAVRLSTSRQPSQAHQRRANPTEIKALCCQKAEDVPET